MTGVKFPPWVGKQYDKGVWGRRVMALGESHYCASPDEATPEITRDVIKDLLNPGSEHEGYKNTYTKFERALAGKALSFDEKVAVWHSIIFYNYVQVSISGARVSPTAQDFLLSEGAFFEVLEEYRPDRVIAWGKRLYNNLPQKGYQLSDIIVATGDKIETWAYETVGGHVVQVLPITHPSSGFVWEYWHEVIKAFINRK